MADPKPPVPNAVPARLYEEDAILLERVAALAILENWPGEWNNQPKSFRSLLQLFISKLPADSRTMLIPTEAKAA